MRGSEPKGRPSWKHPGLNGHSLCSEGKNTPSNAVNRFAHPGCLRVLDGRVDIRGWIGAIGRAYAMDTINAERAEAQQHVLFIAQLVRRTNFSLSKKIKKGLESALAASEALQHDWKHTVECGDKYSNSLKLNLGKSAVYAAQPRMCLQDFDACR